MSTQLEKMCSEVMTLSVKDRAKLAHEIIVSLEQDVDSNHQEIWDKEIEKRITDIKKGDAKGRPAEQVLAEIRAKYQ